jgi:hypothetical protein
MFSRVQEQKDCAITSLFKKEAQMAGREKSP